MPFWSHNDVKSRFENAANYYQKENNKNGNNNNYYNKNIN